jgi:HSP20 family protein
MTLMRFDPFRELDRLSEHLMTAHPMRAMPMEAFRRADEFVVALDLPGISPDDAQVTVEANVVNIHATRKPARQEGDELLVDERPHGEFSRQLFLGENLDGGRLTANFDRGVLTLTIPVAERSKPRRVQIAASTPSPRTVEATAVADAEQPAPANA